MKNIETPILAEMIKKRKLDEKLSLQVGILMWVAYFVPNYDLFWCQLFIFIMAASFTLFQIVTQRKYFRLEVELYDRADKVPVELMERSMRLYGCNWSDGNNWVVAAVECHEAHFPGDCPLCGAK